MTRLHDEMIEDILNTPIEELEEELRQQGQDPDALADMLRERLARAQRNVIAAKSAAAATSLSTSGKRAASTSTASSAPSARNQISSFTLAARNADRPIGFDDPSVDDDLRDLRSDTWDDD